MHKQVQKINNNGFLFLQKLENINAELLDTSEPLIHNTYGYGSQGLINLMITGQAVPHVWDHDKDVGGLSKCADVYYQRSLMKQSMIFVYI